MCGLISSVFKKITPYNTTHNFQEVGGRFSIFGIQFQKLPWFMIFDIQFRYSDCNSFSYIYDQKPTLALGTLLNIRFSISKLTFSARF